MNVADAAVFNKVAESLSFTDAGRLLGMTRSAVSKRIARLEKDLGVVLVNRTPRSISLTDAGHNFYRHSCGIDDAARLAEESVHDTHKKPSGNLSFTMSTALGAALIPALINEFHEQWSDIDLSINLDDRHVDVVGDGYDLAIRFAKKLDDSSLMYKKFATTPEVLVASPGYIQKHGRPAKIADLVHHKCVSIGHMSKRSFVWRFVGPNGPEEVTVTCSTIANNDLAIILAACLGSGILYIPKLLVAGELKLGHLTLILPEYRSARPFHVYAIYPNKNPPARVKEFIDFVEQNLDKLQHTDRWNPLQQYKDI